jgi:hypothetical protein
MTWLSTSQADGHPDRFSPMRLAFIMLTNQNNLTKKANDLAASIAIRLVRHDGII